MLSLFKRRLWTKELTAWYLYDFANSLISINMILYFSQWLIIDKGFTDFWLSVPIIASTIILIFLSTYVGDKGDRGGTHALYFIGSSALVIITVLLAIITGRIANTTAEIVIPLVFYGLYQVFYQLAIVPYYAFIKHIVKPKDYGKISGIGYAMSNVGNIAGLLLTLPLASGAITIFGADRLAPLIPAIIAFFALSLPSYIILGRKKLPKEKKKEKQAGFFTNIWQNLKKSRDYEGVIPLLISFYLFSDAIMTITLYSAIFLEKVFLVPDTVKAKTFIIIIIGFVIGALISGWITGKKNNKRILIIALILCSFSTFGVALNQFPSMLNVIFVLFGLTNGMVYSSSRSYLASLVPVKESGAFFGLYTFAERVASAIGPLVWSAIILIFATLSPLNYRIAVFVMGVLILLGAVPLVMKSKRVAK